VVYLIGESFLKFVRIATNLFGLWSNDKNPFDFPLEKTYKAEGKTISKFEEVINLFKR